MSAEGNLYNPGIFANQHLNLADVSLEYMEIVKGLKTPTPFTHVKGHLFKLMRPAFLREIDLRNRLGVAKGGLPDFEEIVLEMQTRMKVFR
jgi:tRNA-dihydrouridine synthase 1